MPLESSVGPDSQRQKEGTLKRIDLRYPLWTKGKDEGASDKVHDADEEGDLVPQTHCLGVGPSRIEFVDSVRDLSRAVGEVTTVNFTVSLLIRYSTRHSERSPCL